MRFAPEDAGCASLFATMGGKQGKGWQSSPMTWGQVWGSLLVGIMSFTVNSEGGAIAATPPSGSLDVFPTEEQVRLAQYFQPPDTGSLPGRREGGGTRGTWMLEGRPPIALMPESNLGLTSAERPMLYFYVPPEVAGLVAELYMFNEVGEGEGSLFITLPQAGGIVGLPMPAALPPLTVGDTYRWYFAIQVDPVDRSGDLILSGFVRRVADDPALQQRLSTLPIEDHASVYSEQGLWFDAINLLGMMRSQNPDHFLWESQWEALLESVDLEAIATQPMVEVAPESQPSTATSANSPTQ